MASKAGTRPTAAPIGLDLSRQHAQQQHRRRRVRRRIGTAVTALVAVGVVGVVAYVGYEAWLDHEEQSDISERELERLSDDELERYLAGLEERPAWNGPGNPTFGVELTEQP